MTGFLLYYFNSHSIVIPYVILGKLFKSSDIPQIVEFFLMFHKDKPIDWLLDHLLYVKVCNPEKDNVSFPIFTLLGYKY